VHISSQVGRYYIEVMIVIDIVVIDDDNKLYSYIATGLQKSFYVRRFTSRGLWASGEGKPINIILVEDVDKMTFENGIVVLGGISDYKRIRHQNFSYVIANSESDIQMDSLLCCSLPVITCGCSAMDTFSYTSLTDDFLTVSLNRKLTSLSGKEVQPFEIPRPIFEGESVYGVMTLVAVSLLLDDNSEFGKMYS